MKDFPFLDQTLEDPSFKRHSQASQFTYIKNLKVMIERQKKQYSELFSDEQQHNTYGNNDKLQELKSGV